MTEDRTTSPTSSGDADFGVLAARFLDGSIEPHEMPRLNEYLIHDDANGRLFVRMCLFAGVMTESLRPQFTSDATTSDPTLASDHLPSTRVPTLTPLGSDLHGAAGYFSSGWPVAYLTAAVILGVGLLIGAVMNVSHPVQIADQSVPLPASSSTTHYPLPTTHSTVGRITGMVDCRWEKKGLGIRDWGLEEASRSKAQDSDNQKSKIQNPKSLVALGDRFALSSGLMEITYDTGAKVILQGPVTYEVESAAGGFLSVGKLTAKVDSKAENGKRKADSSNPQSPIPTPSLPTTHYPLFTVKTPTAIVTDLGTEFGVEVGEDGQTTSHVYRGMVEIQPATKGGGQQGNSIRLIANESAQVVKDGDGTRLSVRHVSIDPRAFVRQLIQPPRIVDLLDIVAGGNGAGHRRERGIDPCTGMEEPMFQGSLRPGDWKYHRTPYFALIDGVFVPDGSQGPVQIDSAGHTFDFPKTQGGSAGPIWARAVDVPLESLKTDINYWVHYGKFGNEFMPEQRGLLGMHANVGITFDLDAIRKAHGGRQLGRFRATAGKDTGTLADLWVLIDGRLEWKALQITAGSGVSRVEVAIKPEDRFLTLVSTDGGDGPIGGDWTVFGDPVLETVVSGEE